MIENTVSPKKSIENKIHQDGRLLIITGISAAGKDSVFEGIIKHDFAQALGYKRLVTCTDRDPREGEIDGVHYHFQPKGHIHIMYQNNELIEPPLWYRDCYKATPKSEFNEILYKGVRKIWRIDPTLAIKAASGELYDKQFKPHEANHLKKITAVVFVTADQETLTRRRKERGNYNPEKYKEIDLRDKNILENHSHLFARIIHNSDGNLHVSVKQTVEIIHSLHKTSIKH